MSDVAVSNRSLMTRRRNYGLEVRTSSNWIGPVSSVIQIETVVNVIIKRTGKLGFDVFSHWTKALRTRSFTT